MLTTNKAVYGTDGSLTNLGNLKGNSYSGVSTLSPPAIIYKSFVGTVLGEINFSKTAKVHITVWEEMPTGETHSTVNVMHGIAFYDNTAAFPIVVYDDNSRFEWSGQYNEDTDDCTISINDTKYTMIKFEVIERK